MRKFLRALSLGAKFDGAAHCDPWTNDAGVDQPYFSQLAAATHRPKAQLIARDERSTLLTLGTAPVPAFTLVLFTDSRSMDRPIDAMMKIDTYLKTSVDARLLWNG